MRTRSYVNTLAIASIAIAIQFLTFSCSKDDVPAKDSGRVEALIAEAGQKASEAVEGPEPGLYPVGSISLLQTYIDSAQTLVESSVTQFGIDRAEIILRNALNDFIGSVQEEKQVFLDGTAYFDGGAASVFNTAHVTISAWVYPTGLKTGMYIISTEGQRTGYKLQLPSGKPTFQIGVGGASVATLAAADAVNLNEWVHLTATVDGAKIRLYINGVLTVEQDLVADVTDNTENFRIGEGSRFTGRSFLGRIKDVRIWDHALSDADVLAAMTNKLAGTETGLIANWPFNLSAGGVVYDRSGTHALTPVNVVYLDPI